MIGTNYLLLKNNTNLFLLYKQGFKGNKKYLETIEKNPNSSTKNLPKKSKKYVEIHLERMVPPFIQINFKSNVCIYSVTTLYLSVNRGEIK